MRHGPQMRFERKENAGKVRLKPADGEIQMKYKKRNVRWMLVVYDLFVYERNYQ